MNISAKWVSLQLGLEKLEHHIKHKTQAFAIGLASFEGRAGADIDPSRSLCWTRMCSCHVPSPALTGLPGYLLHTALPNAHRKWSYGSPFSISLMPGYFARAPDSKYTETQIFPILFTEASLVLTQNQLSEC